MGSFRDAAGTAYYTALNFPQVSITLDAPVRAVQDRSIVTPTNHPFRPIVVALALSTFAAGCSKSDGAAAKPEAPAQVEHHPDESALSVVTLTEAAEKRLGITTVKAERRPVPRRQTFGGVVEVPPGAALVVSAPLAGTLAIPPDAAPPIPGSRIEAGKPVFRLEPFLTPERYIPTPAEQAQVANATATLAQLKATAAGDVDRARAEVRGAEIALRRAEQLVKDRAGAQRTVDEARAAMGIAEANLAAAETRQRTLEPVSTTDESLDLKPIDISAPRGGVLRTLSVAAGETVPLGEQLFEVVSLERVWVRVPVYVGLADQIASDGEASVSDFSASSGGPASGGRAVVSAKPVAAPPSADPLTASADFIYEIENGDGTHRPGERVAVTVPLRGEEESLVVPWAAVLYDFDGGAWVYVKTGDREFVRHRVAVRYAADGLAVLAAGPEPGADVVVDGAAELFGTEFGAGH